MLETLAEVRSHLGAPPDIYDDNDEGNNGGWVWPDKSRSVMDEFPKLKTTLD